MLVLMKCDRKLIKEIFMRIKLLLFIPVIFFSIGIRAQNGDNNHAIQLAHRIAKKMKDTLDLSAQQRQQIYQANMNLHDQKQAARQNSPQDSLQVRIQRIEKTRDMLYMPILGNEKYQLYLLKKRNLISNN